MQHILCFLLQRDIHFKFTSYILYKYIRGKPCERGEPRARKQRIVENSPTNTRVKIDSPWRNTIID